MKTNFNRLIVCSATLLCAAAPPAAHAADLFVAPFAAWLYLDNGIDQGTAWRNRPSDFDYMFSGWGFGFTQMGFGEGDEFTQLNPSPGGAPLNTAYFTTSFNVSDAGTYSNLTLRVLRDDGAVAYINGVEVFRSNMPTGAVTYATKALRNIEGADEMIDAATVQRVIPANVLVTGQNRLSVEIHQAAGGDNDMSFNAQLIGHRVGENQPPSANSSFVSVEQDKTVAITLDATDPDSNPLDFTLLSFPAHGSLSGVAPNLVYTPEASYSGPDMFSFNATDGQWKTETAYVCIDVKVPSNHPPSAQSQSLSVNEDDSLNIVLGASDPDGDALSFVHTQTSHGSLTDGPGHSVVYQPAQDYFGPDAFSFTVDDGKGGVASGVITISVVSVNDAPIASAQNLSVNEDGSLAILLGATDVEGDALSFSHSQPAHGVVTGDGDHLNYQPAANYNGPDSFDYTVSDGNGGVTTATIYVTVVPVNDAPVALALVAAASAPADFSHALTLIAPSNQGVSVILKGSSSSDLDGDLLSCAWYLDAGTTPFAAAEDTMALLPAGSHTVTLTVFDGAANASDIVSVRIITPCEAVGALAAQLQLLSLKPNERNGLLGHLNAACAQFGKGKVQQGVHQLEEFQKDVSKKVRDAAAAQALNSAAQKIIDAVGGN